MECYCFPRNIQDLLSDGQTPYERRIGMPFNGPVIPFGAMVEYHPVSARDREYINLVQKCCQENVSVMQCTREQSGKETSGRRQELEEMDASELHARRRSMQRK